MDLVVACSCGERVKRLEVKEDTIVALFLMRSIVYWRHSISCRCSAHRSRVGADMARKDEEAGVSVISLVFLLA